MTHRRESRALYQRTTLSSTYILNVGNQKNGLGTFAPVQNVSNQRRMCFQIFISQMRKVKNHMVETQCFATSILQLRFNVLRSVNAMNYLHIPARFKVAQGTFNIAVLLLQLISVVK